MYALVMRWREGRASAIKGMVMPVVKRMGNVQGLLNKAWAQGRESETEKDVFWGIMWEGGTTGAAMGEMFIQVRLHLGYR